MSARVVRVDTVSAENLKQSELERVLDWARLSRFRTTATSCRSIIEVFAETVTALARARVRYVLAGTLAHGLYAPARATENITVLVRDSARARVQRALCGAAFRQTNVMLS